MQIHKNGAAPPAVAVQTKVHIRALPDGTMRFRYMTERGDYLGEVDMYAVSREAARAMIEDLSNRTPRVVVPGIVGG